MHYNIEDRSKIVSDTEEFLDIFNNIKDKSCLSDITKKISKNEIQNLIYLIGGDSSSASIVSKIILTECIRSEYQSSGSSRIILDLLTYYFSKNTKKDSRRDRIQSIEDVRLEIIRASRELSKHAKKSEKDDFTQIIRNMNLSDKVEEQVRNIISQYRVGDIVEIKESKTPETYILKDSGNFLPIDIPQIFLRKSGRWDENCVKVFLIDGIIERISQVHHLLEKASQEKDPYLIICRRASDEVRETIGVNSIRGTINLVLVETDFNVLYHHLFRDLSAIFNCDFVNIQMGDSLSSRLDRFEFIVDRVVISKKGINFLNNNENNQSKDKIRSYISDIKKAAQNLMDSDSESYDDVKKSIDFRVKFLDSSTITLNIGKSDMGSENLEISKIDRFMRSIPDIEKLGIVSIPDKLKNKNKIIEKILSSTSNKDNIFTQRQIFQSLVASYRIYETITRAEKVFTIEN